VFFSGTILRRYLLLVYGFFLPLGLTAAYFMVTGRLNDFVLHYVYPTLGVGDTSYFNWTALLIIFSVPVLFFFLGLFSVVQRGRFTVFQANLSQFMLLWAGFGIVYIFLVRVVVPANLIIFVPPVSYYISQYFLNIRKKWLAEIVFIIFIISPVFFNLGTFFGFFFTRDLVDSGNYIVKETNFNEQINNKKILVLGPDMAPYLNARPATPFLEWSLSQKVFNELNYYDNLSIIGRGFSNDMPQVIIDQEKIMPELVSKIPAFREYRSSDGILYSRN
jgi:hypothetical protein